MKKTIIIVEDEQLLLDMYKLKFSNEGFKVITKTEAKSCLDWLDSHHADLALIDIMLPKMNGLSLIKNLREKPRHNKMKIIILTNLSESDVNLHATVRESLSVDGYFIKSKISPNQLVNKVKALLQ